MHRLLQRWRSRQHHQLDDPPVEGDCILRGGPTSPSLLDLPDTATAILLEFLDMPSLRAVALSCRDALPPLVEAFQSRFVLRLPPDRPRKKTLMQFIKGSSTAPEPWHRRLLDRFLRPTRPHQEDQAPDQRATLQTLTTQFAVADTHHAANLVPLGPRVQGLVISSIEYTAWPERPFRMNILRKFVALERLVVEYAWDRRVDLSVISQSSPQLQEVVIRRAWGVMNQLVGLPKLRVLHLEDTNINSFAIAVGFPKLQSLTLMPVCAVNNLRDVESLAVVPPLQRLVARGFWSKWPCDAAGIHHATLHVLHVELHDTLHYPHAYSWSTMAHLRSLRLGRWCQSDMTPFAVLATLEHLQIVVANTCMDCVPLRQLTRLRELEITDGWVCDVVGFLPRLEKLVWRNDSSRFCDARKTLWQRDYGHDTANGHDTAEVPRLRQLAMRGRLTIHDKSARVRKILEHLEQVDIYYGEYLDGLVQSIARLRHLKRLTFRGSVLRSVRCASDRQVSFACAESLEELFYDPCPRSALDETPIAPLPQWFHDRLPNLRVLASPFQESMVVLGELCPRLTHLHVPYSTQCAFWSANRASLERLCIVSLAITQDCTWLRRERGPGRALPSLERIFHPTTDCLSCPQSCQRHDELGTLCQFSQYRVTSDTVLCAPWAYKWNPFTWPNEAYYRRRTHEMGVIAQ